MLSPQMLVADLLGLSPMITPLFIRLHLDCIGCSLNKFCSLEDLCKYYALDLENTCHRIRDELNKANQ